MVRVGRKAQVLACKGTDIRGRNRPSRRRAFSPVLTRMANTSPTPDGAACARPHPGCGPSRDVGCSQRSGGCGKAGPALGAAPARTQAGQQIPALSPRLPSGYIHRLLLYHGPLPRPRKSQIIPDIVGQQVISLNPPPFDYPRLSPRSPPQAPHFLRGKPVC